MMEVICTILYWKQESYLGMHIGRWCGYGPLFAHYKLNRGHKSGHLARLQAPLRHRLRHLFK